MPRTTGFPRSRSEAVVPANRGGKLWITNACVIDLDNLLHRGFDDAAYARPQARLDVFALLAKLQQQGVRQGSICRNRAFSRLGEELWNKLGFKAVAAGTNCDSHVIRESLCYAALGAQAIVLVAGDGDYSALLRLLHSNGVRVEVWARRSNCAKRLIDLADRVEYVDRFLSERGEAMVTTRTTFRTASKTPFRSERLAGIGERECSLNGTPPTTGGRTACLPRDTASWPGMPTAAA